MYLLDADILIYAATNRDEGKHKLAAELLKRAYVTGEGMVSQQALRETAACLLKIPGNTSAHARQAVTVFRKLKMCQEPADLVIQAMDIHTQFGLEFYDAMVVASAQAASCTHIYSEKLADGQIYGSVQIRNPFHSKNSRQA